MDKSSRANIIVTALPILPCSIAKQVSIRRVDELIAYSIPRNI